MHDLLRCATEQAGPHKGAVMSAGANSIASSLRVCEYRIGAFLNKYKIKLVKKKKSQISNQISNTFFSYRTRFSTGSCAKT